MSASPHDPLPPELDDIGRLMREQRRQPSALELDDLKRRARRQAESQSSFMPLVRKGSLLTSRLMITMLIAFGIVLSGTGATLAIMPNAVNTGSTTSAAQYGSDDDNDNDNDNDDNDNDDNDNDDNDDGTPPGSGGEAGQVTQNPPQGPPIGVAPEGPTSGTAPRSESGGEPPRVQVAADRGTTPRLQPVRQQAEQAEELPFTGLAAIPILVVGIALLGSGLVLRRRA